MAGLGSWWPVNRGALSTPLMHPSLFCFSVTQVSPWRPQWPLGHQQTLSPLPLGDPWCKAPVILDQSEWKQPNCEELWETSVWAFMPMPWSLRLCLCCGMSPAQPRAPGAQASLTSPMGCLSIPSCPDTQLSLFTLSLIFPKSLISATALLVVLIKNILKISH